ncbi:Co2+/Mg2+ efflux protein ApaG [Shewanella sp.]|nr:Co2+/Mg2+ efflux protein ApaG [Shewanella sp.]
MAQRTPDIKVEVKTDYIEAQSTPAEDKYVFSYTITIINLGEQDATLKSRYWLITDGNGENSEVQGAGVVGETPRIKPNTAFQYTSGTVLATPFGVMKGNYTMQCNNGDKFIVQIPEFCLSTPGLLH